MPDTHWRTLRIVTYNIHRCRGLDGRTNPARVAEVIRSIEPDVIALQEVIGAGPNSTGHAEELGALLGMGWVMAPTRHLRGALFGNVVLSRHPIIHHAQCDLSWKTCESRCCQRVDIAFGDDTLHLYNVHLGTAFLERRYQAGRLTAIVHDRRIGQPKVVLGDFNEWMRGLATTMLSERLQSIDLRSASAPETHVSRRLPGLTPGSHLLRRTGGGGEAGLPRTRLALMASDHLPLVAELKIQFR